MNNVDVLVIEDDLDVQLGCVQALKLDKIHAVGVGSVEDARYFLPALRHHGVIVTDMQLPGMSGFAFQKSFNQTDRDVPIIIITGHGDIETAVEASIMVPTIFFKNPLALNNSRISSDEHSINVD